MKEIKDGKYTRNSSQFRWYLTLVGGVSLLLLLMALGIAPPEAIFSDRTLISPLIFLLFGVFMTLHCRNFRLVCREHGNALKILNDAETLVTPEELPKLQGYSGWYLRELVKVYDNMAEGEVSQNDFRDGLEARLTRPESPVSLGANIMITLGLIGTVAGLVIAVSGLETVLDGLKGDTGKLIASLKIALGGMHSAFYTTLFGAILGGFMLKLLVNFTHSIATETTDIITHTAGVYLLPRLKKTPETTVMELSQTVREAQAAVAASAKTVARLVDDTGKVADAFTDAVTAFKDNSTSLAKLTDQLKNNTGNEKLAAAVDKLGESLNRPKSDPALAELIAAIRELNTQLGTAPSRPAAAPLPRALKHEEAAPGDEKPKKRKGWW